MNARSLPSIHLPYALGLILMLQAALTFLDPTPRYLNEDSASYLWSVFAGGPFDRSWTYPAWFLRPLFLLHSIHPVVYVQCALGVIPAWLALRIVSGPSGRDCSLVALATAILCLIEPLALTYQRFILADSLGLVMAATALFLCVRVIDRSPRAPVYAVLAPPFIVLAASLRGSQIPSLALLCALVLILVFVFHRDYRSGAAMLASLVLCQAVFSHYALQHQGTAGYNASSGQFMLAAVLPIVSRDDVERYIDPARIPAILDDNARNPRARPGELFERGKTADQIHQASKSLKDESRLAGRIATHAILRNPIGLLGLAWSSYLDYFDERYMHNRILIEQGMREFEPNELANLADHEIHGVANNVDLESPVRTYFKAGWRYYGLIPAISAILLAAALIVDRRLSTLTLAGFALASAASHVAFSTEPVPRYLVATAWANIVAAGSIASVLAAGPVEFPAGARAAIAWVNANARLLKPLDRPLAWGACFVAGFAIVASWFSTDGTFDFANYHLYNGFAFFHDRRGLDIFPAHLQTAFYYGTDTVYYLIFTWLNNHPYLINLLLSIPYAAAALAVFIIARMFAEPGFRLPILVSLAAVIFGFSGASTYATFLTTQSDMVPGLAVLVALAVWLALERFERNSVWTALALGGLAGVSVGLKLTQAPMFVGMAVAIAARFATGRRSALREAFAFGLAGLVVFVALDGAWLWSNFKAYGNPIFPVMNNVFKSDLIDFGRWTDQRFLPKSARMALFYPAYWAFHPSSDVSELLMRDPRILLGCMSALIILLGFLWRWRRDRSAPRSGARSRSASHWRSCSSCPTRCGRRSGRYTAISPFKRA